MKNIQDIIPDREIIKQDNLTFAGLDYEVWKVEPPIFSDQVEQLLENRFMLFIDDRREIFVERLINSSPDVIMQNKKFWRKVNEVLDDKREARST